MASTTASERRVHPEAVLTVRGRAADVLGTLDRRIKGAMKRFKQYIEQRGEESGAWRGRIRPEGQ